MKQCMIFAAGLGTRLKPITDTMPKALVPVADKPLLEHLLQKIKNAGFERVIINVHHFSEQIVDFVAKNDFGMEICISDESEQLLETGGGIKKAEKWMDISAPCLVHNVDILSNLDIEKLYNYHNTSRLATVLVSQRTTNRYLLFNNKNRLVGWTNTATGEVKTPYESLNLAACKRLAFAGIHVISPQIFELMKAWNGKFSIIDFYLSVAKTHEIIGYEAKNLELFDVGKIGSLHEAERFAEKLLANQ